MTDLISHISRNFDLRNFSRSCNIHGCNRLPTKEAVIVEFDPKTGRRRELVSLYFCGEHYNKSIKKIMRDIKKIENTKVIDKNVFDIGYVTH